MCVCVCVSVTAMSDVFFVQCGHETVTEDTGWCTLPGGVPCQTAGVPCQTAGVPCRAAGVCVCYFTSDTVNHVIFLKYQNNVTMTK